MPFQLAPVFLERARFPPLLLARDTSPRSPTLQATAAVFARATPTVDSGIIPITAPPKWIGGRASGQNRWRGVNTERTQPCARFVKGRLKHPSPGQSLRLQSLAPTGRPYSERTPLGVRSSRCSPDLFPLRGVPTQPLGLRPPLRCLRGRSRNLRKGGSSRRCGTSGYRSGWAWKPLRRLAPTSLGFVTSSDLRKPSSQRGRTREGLAEDVHASANDFSGLPDVTRCD